MTSLICSGKIRRKIAFNKYRGFSLFYLQLLNVFVLNHNLKNTKASVFPEVEKSLELSNFFVYWLPLQMCDYSFFFFIRS